MDAGGLVAEDGGGSGGSTTECAPRETGALPDGYHPARYDYTQGNLGCMGNTCHNGTMGSAFSVAGAVYDALRDGGDPVGGAHVFVTDGGGREFEAVTASNGFFWIQDAVTPPLTTSVSICPDRLAMLGPASGNCNGGGACHVETNKIFIMAAP